MVSERKPVSRARPQPPRPADAVIRSGLANRGFGSLDPERQREVGGDATRTTPRDAPAQPGEGGTAPRGAARDQARAPARTKDSGRA